MSRREEQLKMKQLLVDAITLLCRSGLQFQFKFCVEALIGITLDDEDVVLVSFKETVSSDGVTNSQEWGEADDQVNQDCAQAVPKKSVAVIPKNAKNVRVKAESASGDNNSGFPESATEYTTRGLNSNSFGVAQQRKRKRDRTEHSQINSPAVKSEISFEETPTVSTGRDAYNSHLTHDKIVYGDDNTEQYDEGSVSYVAEETDNVDDCFFVKSEGPNEYDNSNEQEWGEQSGYEPGSYDASGVELNADYMQGQFMHQQTTGAMRSGTKGKHSFGRPGWKSRSMGSAMSRPKKMMKQTASASTPQEEDGSVSKNSIGRSVMQCNFCPLVFTTLQSLNDHVNGLHFQKKMYSCVQCGQTYKWRADLSKHRRVSCPYRLLQTDQEHLQQKHRDWTIAVTDPQS